MALWKNYSVLYTHSKSELDECEQLVGLLGDIYKDVNGEGVNELQKVIPCFTNEERAHLFVMLHEHCVGVESLSGLEESVRKTEAYSNMLKVSCDLGVALDLNRRELKISTQAAMAAVSACMTVLNSALSAEQYTAALWKMMDVCKHLTGSITASDALVKKINTSSAFPMESEYLSSAVAELQDRFTQLREVCGVEAPPEPKTSLETCLSAFKPAPEGEKRNEQLECIMSFVERRVVVNILKQLFKKDIASHVIAAAVNLCHNMMIPRETLTDLLLQAAEKKEQYVWFLEEVRKAESAPCTPVPLEIKYVIGREIYFTKKLFQFLQDKPDVSQLPFQRAGLPAFFVYCANDIIEQNLHVYAGVLGSEVEALILAAINAKVCRKIPLPQRLSTPCHENDIMIPSTDPTEDELMIPFPSLTEDTEHAPPAKVRFVQVKRRILK